MSEAVYKEYDQLKNKYDVETEAMHKAMDQATNVSVVCICATYKKILLTSNSL